MLNSFRVDFSGQLPPAIEKIHQVGKIIKNKEVVPSTLKQIRPRSQTAAKAHAGFASGDKKAPQADKHSICRIENSGILP